MAADTKKNILVIEDDPGISMAVRDELEFEGFRVEVANNGRVGLESILRAPPHLVLLDIMLPGQNGFQICKDIRAHGIATPIIVLTARGQEADRVRGLELGADDYITKPFSLAELVARVRAVLRRTEPEQRGDTIKHGAITIDFRKREVMKGRGAVELTDKEFQILGLMMKRSSEVITRDEFLSTIWGEDVYVTPRTIDIHISSLRKKLEDDPDHPALIVSVRNAGYKFNTD
jgi:DNA-binding response OmpR family regulator